MTGTPFNFDDWLGGVEAPAEGVTIYQKPGLIGQLQKAVEAYELAKDQPVETTIGETSPKDRIARLRAEIHASKTVWYVSPLTREQEDEVEELYPEPDAPATFDVPPPRMADRANPVQAKAFMEAFGAWKIEHAQWEKAHAIELQNYQTQLEDVAVQRGCERLARAITYIETFDANGASDMNAVVLTKDDMLEAERRLGQGQIGLLAETLRRVSTEPPEDPDPFESLTS